MFNNFKTTNITKISGGYYLATKKLTPKFSADFSYLLIGERKNTTPTKSKHFLLIIRKNGKRDYVSSLYSIADNSYKFDYQGFSYELRLLGNDAATIVKRSKNGSKWQ